MAIKLENKANVTAPNASYPYGNIKDDTGVGDGTPVDVQVYADMHQFLARLLDQSGITINNLPDNATNGFQLYEALRKLVAGGLPYDPAGAWINAGTPVLTADAGTVSVFSTTYNKYKIIGKTLFWQVAGGLSVTGSPNEITVAWPAGAAPITNDTAPKMTMGYFRDGLTIVDFKTTGAVMRRYPTLPFAGSAFLYTFSCVIELP